ncbi:MAG: aminotransferase class V-fold PLP-dependent enzyme [Halobacteriota archaeon]
MTPLELRESMPALESTVYLNTGASGPSPRPVVDAVTSFVEYHEYDSPGGEGMYSAAWGAIDETRSAVASLLGTVSENIALTQSTTDGINRIACAHEWSEDDTVVRTDLEHSAGILPWDRLARRHGVTVEVVETDRGRVDLDEFAETVADATLVTFSAVDWLYGRRHPVRAMTEVAHDAGARVLVDGVQAPGQMPVDLDEWGVDFVAAAGHKWLLGPWGAGFLYVRPGLADQLEPGSVGYRSVEEANDENPTYYPGARRFEIGTTNPAPYVGLQASIDGIEQLGLDTIERRIERLTDYLKAGLPDDALLSPQKYTSGLVSFTVDDAAATVDSLAEDGVQIRSLPVPDAIRASVHAFNTEDDIDRLLDGL